jgi:hypothetical protein
MPFTPLPLLLLLLFLVSVRHRELQGVSHGQAVHVGHYPESARDQHGRGLTRQHHQLWKRRGNELMNATLSRITTADRLNIAATAVSPAPPPSTTVADVAATAAKFLNPSSTS